MRFLALLCFFLAQPAFAQDAQSLGKSSVSAVLDQYTINPLVRLPDTHNPLPPTGKWSIRTTRPDSCPHDDSPCARVVYTVPEANVACEWTVVPGRDGAPNSFLDENEDASHYLLRKLQAVDLTPLVLTSPQPVYPPIARAAHISGAVVVRLVVSGKGVVTSATPVSGPAMLFGASADAAKKWTFRPLQVGTQSASFTVDLNASYFLVADPSNCTKDNVCRSIPNGTASLRP
jgi:TonB family protein